MGKITVLRNLFQEEQLTLAPRKSLSDEAADAIRELILLEKLLPGSDIRERDLAEALRISRTPIREAMRQLEIEGLIHYSETRRPRVADPSIEEIAKNLDVLGVLEQLAGELAGHHATDEELNHIRLLNEKMRATSATADPLDFFKTDMAFHRSIVLASCNESLIETHSIYNARLWRARFISSKRKQDRNLTLKQHQAITDALLERKKAKAGSSLKQHLKTTIINISKTMAEKKNRNHNE